MSSVMQGFPPNVRDQVTLENWRTAPFNQWAFHHVREIAPSAIISNNPNAFCTGNGKKCLTHNFWEDLENLIGSYLQSISLNDLVSGNKKINLTRNLFPLNSLSLLLWISF